MAIVTSPVVVAGAFPPQALDLDLSPWMKLAEEATVLLLLLLVLDDCLYNSFCSEDLLAFVDGVLLLVLLHYFEKHA